MFLFIAELFRPCYKLTSLFHSFYNALNNRALPKLRAIWLPSTMQLMLSAFGCQLCRTDMKCEYPLPVCSANCWGHKSWFRPGMETPHLQISEGKPHCFCDTDYKAEGEFCRPGNQSSCFGKMYTHTHTVYTHIHALYTHTDTHCIHTLVHTQRLYTHTYTKMWSLLKLHLDRDLVKLKKEKWPRY